MQENKRILRITGKGESASAPDTIIISLNISGEDKNYQKAMENADNAVMKLKNALTRAGFDEKKITTEDFRVQTVNKYVKKLTEEKYVFDKYRVSNYLQIKFEFNTKKLAKCVDVIVDSTSEPNFNIDFSVENTEKLKEKALMNAVENATRQAKILSKSAGVSLGEIMSIDNSFSEVNVYKPRELRMQYDGAVAKMSKASASMESLNVQDIKINANVTITWEIK